MRRAGRRHDEPFDKRPMRCLAKKCVLIYDREEEGWAWGQLVSDGYVGIVSPRNALKKLGRRRRRIG